MLDSYLITQFRQPGCWYNEVFVHVIVLRAISSWIGDVDGVFGVAAR